MNKTTTPEGWWSELLLIEQLFDNSSIVMRRLALSYPAYQSRMNDFLGRGEQVFDKISIIAGRRAVFTARDNHTKIG